jgi:transposase-like protein
MRKRRTADQWREIFRAQRELGRNDADSAKDHGVSVASLRSWRKKLRDGRAGEPPVLVELQHFAAREDELRVTLPNGVVLSVGSSWPLEHLVRIAGLLRAL